MIKLFFLSRKRGAFFNVIREGPHWGIDEHRDLLRAMLMTVCDLAAITKPWEIEKRVAELVSSEFFEQGDIEREKLNITPIVSSIYYLHAPFLNTCLFSLRGQDIMNREKQDQLPLMQVGFIDSICLPIYEVSVFYIGRSNFGRLNSSQFNVRFFSLKAQ